MNSLAAIYLLLALTLSLGVKYGTAYPQALNAVGDVNPVDEPKNGEEPISGDNLTPGDEAISVVGDKDSALQVFFSEMKADNIYINILGDVADLPHPSRSPHRPTDTTTTHETSSDETVPPETTTETITETTTTDPLCDTSLDSTTSDTMAPESTPLSSCITDLLSGFGYYKFHPEVVTWAEAVDTCYTEGGHLLILSSKQEYDAVFAAYGGSDGLKVHYGAHYDLASGNFTSLFGQTLEETGYNTWLFDHVSTGSEKYPVMLLYLNPYERGTGLEDVETGPGFTLPFICKRFL